MGLGKKAIGYIRGLNGQKLAMLASSLVSKKYPVLGASVTPVLSYAGGKFNDLMDYLAADNSSREGGGVHKPLPPSIMRFANNRAIGRRRAEAAE